MAFEKLFKSAGITLIDFIDQYSVLHSAPIRLPNGKCHLMD
jgi:hypothetical protein